MAAASASSSAMQASTSKLAGRRSKWAVCMDQVFSKQRVAKSGDDKQRFFQDLFCLRPSEMELTAMVDKASETQLLTTYQPNVSDLFTNAVRTLKIGGVDDLRCINVLETLVVFCRCIFIKRFPNFALDVINVLAGSLDKSDSVFNDFVAALDTIMRDPEAAIVLRRKALHLTLTVVAGVGQASLNAYFLRRDLFNTIATLIAERETTSISFDAVCLLGLLANFRKYETRNPYLTRIEDYVNEKAMEKIVALVDLALIEIRQSYLDVMDDTPPSFVGSVASLVGSLRLSEFVKAPLGGFTTITNPPTTTETKSNNTPASTTSSLSSTQLFQNLPKPQACILLPVYDLLHSNKSFLSLLLAHDQFFLANYLSVASYIFTHASGGTNSKAYARLILFSMMVMIEEGGRGLCNEDRSIKVRLCRQRVPHLPVDESTPRPPISAVLDCAVLFLRHNLQKRLGIDSYRICMRLIFRVLVTLQFSRVRLDYDWIPLWQALMSLGSLIASRHEDLCTAGHVEKLAQQILDIFSFAAIWADTLFKGTTDVTNLYFEILRADLTLKKLGDIAGVGPLPSVPTLGGAGSPRPSTHGNPINSNAGPATIEAARNIRRIVAHFSDKIEVEKKNRGGLGANEVLKTIEVNIDALDLIDSSSLDDLPRYSEVEHDTFFKTLSNIVAQDTLKFIRAREPLYQDTTA